MSVSFTMAASRGIKALDLRDQCFLEAAELYVTSWHA